MPLPARCSRSSPRARTSTAPRTARTPADCSTAALGHRRRRDLVFRTLSQQKAPLLRGFFLRCRSCAEVLGSALTRLCTGAAGLLGFPRLVLFEQGFTIGLARHRLAGAALLQEVVETIALRPFHRMALEPLARGRQPLPAGERRRKRDLLPLRMEGRVLERRKLGEEG